MKTSLLVIALSVTLLGACNGQSTPEDTAATDRSATPEATEDSTDTTDTEESSADAAPTEDRTETALAGYDLPQEATIEFQNIGTVNISYPADWTHFNDYFIISDEGVNIFLGLDPGQTYMQFSANAPNAFESETIADYAKAAYSGQAATEELTYPDPEPVAIAGDGIAEVAVQTATKDEKYDVAIYTLMAEGGEYVTFQVYTAPGELNSQAALVEAVLASIRFEPAAS